MSKAIDIVVPSRHPRSLYFDAPDDYFVDFPLAEDFAEKGCEYLNCNEAWGSAGEVGRLLCETRLKPLASACIGYLWKRNGGTRAGKAVLGKAVRASALVRTFTDRLGFVILAADHVRAFKLTNYQIEALIYHELLHFRFEDGALATQGHDFEAFQQEVEHYGLWKPDLDLAAESFKQIDLFRGPKPEKRRANELQD